MQCLLFSRSEEEKEGGKTGRRRKEKKIAFIRHQCLLQPPPSILLSSTLFPLLVSSVSIPSFLASPHSPSPSLHPPPPFADQNQLSSMLLLELFSSLCSFISFSSAIVFFFCHHSYHIKRIPPTARRTFIPRFCAYTSARAHFFCERETGILDGKFVISECRLHAFICVHT